MDWTADGLGVYIFPFIFILEKYVHIYHDISLDLHLLLLLHQVLCTHFFIDVLIQNPNVSQNICLADILAINCMNRCLHRVRTVGYCLLWKQSSTLVEIWISCFDFIIIKKPLIDTSHTGVIQWRNPSVPSPIRCALHWQPVSVARLNTTYFQIISSDTIPKLRWDLVNYYDIPKLILCCVPWYFQLRKLYLVNDAEWDLFFKRVWWVS